MDDEHEIEEHPTDNRTRWRRLEDVNRSKIFFRDNAPSWFDPGPGRRRDDDGAPLVDNEELDEDDPQGEQRRQREEGEEVQNGEEEEIRQEQENGQEEQQRSPGFVAEGLPE